MADVRRMSECLNVRRSEPVKPDDTAHADLAPGQLSDRNRTDSSMRVIRTTLQA